MMSRTMLPAVVIGPASAEESRTSARNPAHITPAMLAFMALASTLIPASLIWDFSWESTIGVDRFWSPPHLAMHAGVWCSGLAGLWLMLRFTVSRSHVKPVNGVSIGRFWAPSGAWITVWGAATMQAATLFDNWWQQAYGLGAGIWHPPQMLKAVAFFTILFGGLVLSVSAGSSSKVTARTATAFVLWQCGLLLVMCGAVLMQGNYPNWQHAAGFYKTSCAIYPALMMMAGSALSSRRTMTRTALVYTVVVSMTVWLLPLFPAHPKTPPIHNPPNHMIPPPFPLLLIVPAFVLDFFYARLSAKRLHEAWLALLTGITFAVLFIPVQWCFSRFLLSPTADNWFFAGGGKHWPYFLKIDQARVMFWNLKQDPFTWRTALVAAALAIASSWAGLRAGGWLRRLRR